jgi:hypothetical protein
VSLRAKRGEKRLLAVGRLLVIRCPSGCALKQAVNADVEDSARRSEQQGKGNVTVM